MADGPHVLVILDGFGERSDASDNAITQAHTPNYTAWRTQYGVKTLAASGTAVGLLPHMIGNSEVGHLTIGSGRRIAQPVREISESITQGEFFHNPLLTARLSALSKHKTLHIMGLLSDAGVHSHSDHLYALLELAHQKGIQHVVVHPFLDGRDVPPQSAARYLEALEERLAIFKRGSIGSLHGRFYAMDRDNHWDRTYHSYQILSNTQASTQTWQEALAASYEQKLYDEFVVPQALVGHTPLEPGDGLICFNFRADRARQITRACIEQEFAPFVTRPLDLAFMLTFTAYHPDFPVDVLLRAKTVHNTLCDVLEAHDVPFFTIAETEKYAHVTYFFNGGRETAHRTETRILIPSKRHGTTYVDVPCMSAPEITQSVLTALSQNNHQLYIINYANADMVGHSGDFSATIKAIECLDKQLGTLYQEVVHKRGGTIYVTADHGNAEQMWDPDADQPRTAHTCNLVPFMVINHEQHDSAQVEELADIAPYILSCMGLPVPAAMVKE